MFAMDESLTSKIRSARPPKAHREAGKSMGWTREYERDDQGCMVPCRTYFLVGSECRFSCSMCDLWKYTLMEPRTPVGSLAVQIEDLHRQVAQDGLNVEGPEWLKLYNASNFFDPANVDFQEHESIAKQCAPMDRVIVENHAALLASNKIREQVCRFRDMLSGDLEVAMGLETIDPQGMRWLNKSMTLEQFEQGVEFLRGQGISVRAFVLLQPLGTAAEESVEWAIRSCRQAARWGVQRICLIPTRMGNGFMESAALRMGWNSPTAGQLERAFESLLGERDENHRPGVFDAIYTVDLWDWGAIPGTCAKCRSVRFERLERMNHTQVLVHRDIVPPCDCVALKQGE